MKFNKLFGILLLIGVLCLCIGAAAAADDVDSQAVGAEDGNLAVENDNDDVLSAGNSWYVKAGATGGDGSQNNPYGDLKSALDNTNLQEGDTIYVMSGTYKGTSNTGLTIDKNNLNIVSADDKKPVFDGENSRQIFKITGHDVVLKGLQLTKGKSSEGGALYIDGNNVHVDKCTINSNTNTNNQKGGAIYIADHENVLITNSAINSNKAKYSGGAIYNTAPNTLIANCSFYNGIANSGGGIYSDKKIRIVNTSMSSCKNAIVDGYGGGICLKGSDASDSVIDNVSFSSSYADQGGAIALVDCNHVVVNNCEMANSISITSTNQVMNGDGAAIWMNGKNNLINNTYIHDSHAYGWGIIYIPASSEAIVINNCSFARNTCDYHGSAIYSRSDDLLVNNSYFEKNHCSKNGGAIYVGYGNNIIVKNSEFVGNYAERGGAIFLGYLTTSDGKILRCTNPVIDNCTFTGNGVFPSPPFDGNISKGGAIFSYAQNTHFFDSTFEGNVGLSSGAIQLVGNDNTIEGCTFKNNIANHYGGGAISSGSTSDTVSNCVFENNRAVGYGGAISMNYVTVVDSIFTENSADHGGAIYTINATVKNCEFNENQANNNWVVLAEDTLELSGNKNLGELVIIDNGLLMATSATPQIPVQFGNKEKIKITTSEDGNIAYADGYVAYCVEELTDAPTFGVLRSDVSAVKNAVTQEQVGEYLKLLVYHYGDKYEYEDFAKLVHIFTETDYTSSDNEIVKDVLARFNNGESLPDVYIEKQDDGSFVQYTFKSVIVPQATQNLLLYNISSVVPNMTVEKISNNVTAKVGDLVSFDITVNNTGNCTLTGVYVIDSDYTDGLKYDHFVDETGKWSYEGNGKFVYKGALKANQTAKFTVVFEALTEGFKVNNVTAGNNLTNDTVNSTNTTNVTVVPKNETDVPENETDVPENETDVPENKTVDHKKVTKTTKAKTVKSNVENATGNPLLLLLAALIIPVIRFKRK